jgi:hypothetical protein
MGEQIVARQAARERMVYRYLTALKEEDINTLLDVLAKAEQDAVLEEMLWRIHEVNLQAELSLDEPESAREKLPLELLTTKEEHFDQPDNLRRRRVPKKVRRVSLFLQTLAAVIAVCTLVGGFLVILDARRNSSPGSGTQLFRCFVSAPLPQQQVDAQLVSVAVVAENDAWTVGVKYENNIGLSTTLIEHWNGQSWQIVASPNVNGRANVLTSVTAISKDNVWAVGQAAKKLNGPVAQTLIEHWDGRSWQIVPSKNLAQEGTNTLTGIAAVSANDIWAVGIVDQESPPPGKPQYQALIEHWDGQSWQLVSSSNPGAMGSTLIGVVAISKDNVWAVGGLIGETMPLIEHWNGRAWSMVASPVLHGVGLIGIAAVGANDIWAVGNGLVEHWDGHSWRLVTNDPKLALNVVIALAPNDVWAVGSSHKDPANFDTLVEHWDGKNWKVIASPNPGPSRNRANELEGVAATPSGKIWIVGFQQVSGSPTRRPLIVLSTCS